MIIRLLTSALLASTLASCGLNSKNESLSNENSSTIPDWTENATLPSEGHRANIYQIEDKAEWEALVWAGKKHLVGYPVVPTGILIPHRLMEKVMGWWLFKKTTGWDGIEGFYDWLGLHPFPETEEKIPFPEDERPSYPMGVSMRTTTEGDRAMTFGCAACHSSSLFGKQVLGLTNRFPRANEAFVRVHRMSPLIQKAMVDMATDATPGELKMLMDMKETFRWIEDKKPAALGLDTSLAQVGLSLAKRELDPYASKTPEAAANPRPSPLSELNTDSKPAVWWNLKYKTRFLSDGSLVAGNPIHTNFLWNEIGRGADLRELETWLTDNPQVVREMTAAAFATEAPRYTEFFPAESINLEAAKKGEAIFNNSCSRCHGVYEKAWNQAEAASLPLAEQLKTTKVHYHPQTPVKDVGTDPLRAQGMQHFAGRLNELAISQTIGTTVTPQQGYVPPPLVGIWARWPYFHNNSAPSLCAVLTRSDMRPITYYSGKAVNPELDFDQECNGYPLADKAPKEWRTKEHLFDARVSGLTNLGHDEGIFLKDGKELLTDDAKRALIQFLKTL